MLDPLDIPHVWRAQSLAVDQHLEPTGFAAFDSALGGGWPKPAMIELLTDSSGIGELQLVLPLLRSLIAQATTPPIVTWFNPPYEPNAVALAQHGLMGAAHWLMRTQSRQDTLWSMEQSLRSGACAAVLAWTPCITTPSLRRLKLAVSSGQTYAIVYRPAAAATTASPAHVRLLLEGQGSTLRVDVLKARSRPASRLSLDVDPARLRQGSGS